MHGQSADNEIYEAIRAATQHAVRAIGLELIRRSEFFGTNQSEENKKIVGAA